MTSLPSSAPGAEYLTLASPSTTTLDSVQSIANPSPSTVPPGVDFPIGHLNFEVSGVTVGGATTVTLYVPSDSNVNTYYKYGPTPDNATPHWYQFLYDGVTGAEFFTSSSDSPKRIVLHYVDGARGDDDLVANGIVVDPGGPAQATVIVTTDADVANGDTSSVTALLANPGADNAISLREAILAANADAGADTIDFNIPGGGVRTISVSTALPAIVHPVTINGYSQPGSSMSTFGDGQGTNASLAIQISGAGAVGPGLSLQANDSIIRGLTINNFANQPGIEITGSGNLIEGNFIGTNPTGTAPVAASCCMAFTLLAQPLITLSVSMVMD